MPKLNVVPLILLAAVGLWALVMVGVIALCVQAARADAYDASSAARPAAAPPPFTASMSSALVAGSARPPVALARTRSSL